MRQPNRIEEAHRSATLLLPQPPGVGLASVEPGERPGVLTPAQAAVGFGVSDDGEQLSLLDQLEESSEWDGTLPVPYGVIPF